MRHIYTDKNPSHCPKCMSENIELTDKHFKKDMNGKKNNRPFLGIWMCNNCGNVIGRRMNEYENEIDENSL